MTYASARRIAYDAAESVNPTDHTTVAESAARNLKVIIPDGDLGNWSPFEAPYMIEPMNLLRSRLFEAIVYVGASRSGKTFAMVDAGLAYTIVDDPADCGVFHMTRDAAETWAEKRLHRGIHGSPELLKRLSPHAHDDNKLSKTFRNGMEIDVGWQSKSQMSQKDLRRVFIPDADNATGTLTIAESFAYGLARIRSFGTSGICAVEGNPANDFDDPGWKPSTPNEAPPARGLLSLYNTGDRRRWWWACPECRQRFQARPGLANFRLPDIEELRDRVLVDNIVDLAEKFGRIFCERCGVDIDPRWKKQMNLGGVWVGEGQTVHDDGTVTGDTVRSRRASFWAGGVMSCYDTWQSMLERHFAALKQWAKTGDTQPIKAEMNTGQAMPFVPALLRTRRDESALHLRATGAWKEGEAPEGVRFLLCLIDVQAGRRSGFPCMIMGVGEHGQRWVIDRFHLRSSRRANPHPEGEADKWLRLDPAMYPQDWDRLTERCITRVCPIAGDPKGRVMAIKFAAFDSGGQGAKASPDGDTAGKRGGVTTNAYAYWRRLRDANLSYKALPVKGTGLATAPRIEVTWPDARKRQDRHAGSIGDVPLLRINTDLIKDAVALNIWRDPGPGHYHFPAWCKAPFFDELQVEVKGAKGWDNPSGRPNEAFDHFVYAEALLIHLGADQIDWKNPPPWADVLDRNPLVYAPDQPPTPVAALPRRPASDFWRPRR